MSFKPLRVMDIRQWNTVPANKKRKKEFVFTKNEKSEIDLSHGYGVLSDDGAEEKSKENMKINQKNETGKLSEAKVKKFKIPPLVIYTHIEDHVKSLQQMLKESNEKFSMVCKQNRLIIYTKNEHDYAVMRKKIEAAQVSFHTYFLDSEKPIVSILKGLPSNITPLEIKEELENEHELKVLEVKQFIKQRERKGKISEIKLPIFNVKFEKNRKIVYFKKIRVLCG